VRGIQVIVPVTSTAASIPPARPSRPSSPWPAAMPPEGLPAWPRDIWAA